jgi:hypothetical protein
VLEAFIMATDDSDDINSQYRISVRFGDELLEAGWTVLPNVLLRYQSDLKITPDELNFIAQVWYHWWSDKDAYPGIPTVARRMGKHADSVRRYSRSLQEKEFLVVRDRYSRALGQMTSEYDFSPLIDRLKALWRVEKAQRQAADADWEIIPRDRKNTPSANLQRGGSANLQRGGMQQRRPNKTKKKKTQGQENPTNSNSFDLVANLQKPANFQNSKKRDEIQSSSAHTSAEPAEPSRQASSFKPVGQLLSGRGVTRTASVGPENGSESPYYPSTGTESHPVLETASQARRGRPRKHPLPPGLELFTRDITDEFHDSSKLPSNLSFIGRMLHETGLHPDVLYQLMQEARQLTKARGNIEKASADDPGFRNRFPYFRKTLLDLVEKEGRAVSARRGAPVSSA